MSRKLRVLGVGAFALTLFLFSGCGSDKNLDPMSLFVYDGPYPATLIADSDPAYTRLQYFQVHIEMSDPNLSIVPSRDSWTVLGMTGTYAITDPGGHILAPLPDLAQTTTATVTSRSPLNYPITLLTQEWLEDNAAGLIDSPDEVSVTLTAAMSVRRNRDGLAQTVPITFTYILKDVQ